MEYSVEPISYIEESNLDENKTIFLSQKPRQLGVQYHESDFEDDQDQDDQLNTGPVMNNFPKGNTQHICCPNCKTVIPIEFGRVAEVEPESDAEEDESVSTASTMPLSFMESLTEEEQDIFHEECLRLFEDYFECTENRAKLSSPMIEQLVATDITTTIYEMCEIFYEDGKMPRGFAIQESDYEEIYEYVHNEVVQYAFQNELFVKPRQHSSEHGKSLSPLEKAVIKTKLDVLAKHPNPPQRTQEWYDSRYDALTASNIWKALGSEAQRNSLIYEKCKPYDQFVAECLRHSNLSTENAMHWGIKYEPVTVQIYERMNGVPSGLNTNYGCIRHPDYGFIGASPDAIVTDPASPKYGRMVEIKNIVNREITGVPLEHYWIQMQIQMEVCDLDECDFVETQIREYVSDSEFYENANKSEYRGVIVRFVERLSIDAAFERHKAASQRQTQGVCADSLMHKAASQRHALSACEDSLMHKAATNEIETKPAFYEYSPFLFPSHSFPSHSLDKTNDRDSVFASVQQWIKDVRAKHAKDYVAHHISYWYLDKYSCVKVPRNQAWFDAVLPQLQECWETIQREKREGYEHRKPNAKTSTATKRTGPLIQINKLDFDLEPGPSLDTGSEPDEQ